jgi:hypothetical protein
MLSNIIDAKVPPESVSTSPVEVHVYPPENEVSGDHLFNDDTQDTPPTGTTPVETFQAGQEDESEEIKHTTTFYLAYFTLLLGVFMVPLELSIVSSALAAISKDLNAPSNKAYWCGTGYILAQTVAQPLYGSVSEIFGRKIMLQISFLIFLLGSILCSRAQDINWLIATRVVGCISCYLLYILI